MKFTFFKETFWGSDVDVLATVLSLDLNKNVYSMAYDLLII
jgi:hypothetical protein